VSRQKSLYHVKENNIKILLVIRSLVLTLLHTPFGSLKLSFLLLDFLFDHSSYSIFFINIIYFAMTCFANKKYFNNNLFILLFIKKLNNTNGKKNKKVKINNRWSE